MTILFRMYCKKLTEAEEQKQKHFLAAFHAKQKEHHAFGNNVAAEEFNSSQS